MLLYLFVGCGFFYIEIFFKDFCSGDKANFVERDFNAGTSSFSPPLIFLRDTYLWNAVSTMKTQAFQQLCSVYRFALGNSFTPPDGNQDADFVLRRSGFTVGINALGETGPYMANAPIPLHSVALHFFFFNVSLYGDNSTTLASCGKTQLVYKARYVGSCGYFFPFSFGWVGNIL